MATTSQCRHRSAIVSSSSRREDLAGRVVRRVDDDGARRVRERARELVGIERPVGLAQRHEPRHRARENRVGPVVLVERLEDDHLVAGIDDAEHRRDHRLGRAAADGDLRVGIDRHAVPAREVVGDRVAQAPRAPGHRVLVDVGVDGARRRRLDLGRRRKIGKPLRQVDRAVRCASRVISRITDSVNCAALSEARSFVIRA